MPNIYKAIASLGIIIAIIAGSYIYGRLEERKILTAKYDIAAQEAIDAALAKERKLNEAYNKSLEERINEESDINTRLIADLNKLHERESRRTRSKNKCTCRNAIGSELSREDAEFLARFAASCDGVVVKYNQLRRILDSIAEQQNGHK